MFTYYSVFNNYIFVNKCNYKIYCFRKYLKFLFFLPLQILFGYFVKVCFVHEKRCNMADISIKKSLSTETYSGVKKEKSSYSELKKEYEKFLKKSSKSDLANAPTMKDKELEFLSQLKVLAEKEGLEEEVKMLTDRQNGIFASLEDKPSVSSAYYSPVSLAKPSFKGKTNKPAQNFAQVIDACKNKHGEVDENTLKVIMAFKDYDLDEYHLQSLVQKCRNHGDTVSDNVVNAVQVLASYKVSSAVSTQVIEELLSQNPEVEKGIDLTLCNQVGNYKTAGFDDLSAFKFAKLSQAFDDKTSLKDSVIKLAKADIRTDSTVKLLNELAVESPQTGNKKVSADAVKSVVSLKKALSVSRHNEKAEQDNPIGKLGTMVLNFSDGLMILKDNKVIKCSKDDAQNIGTLKMEYADLIAELEDNVLLDYVKKYKDNKGEINPNFLRTLTSLRHSGIAYPQLIEMTDFCTDGNSVDKNKLSAIGELKKAGALGADIIHILENVEKTSNGEYSKEDMQNAADLTATVLGGNEVAALLPEVRNNENVKDFFVYFSQIMEHKSNLPEFLTMIKDANGSFDENAMDVLYNLAQNFFVSENGAMSEADFMKNSTEILKSAKDSGEAFVNDEGAGICSIMSQNKESAENIIKGLELCKTKAGKIDEQLAEILWDMCSHQADISEIETVLNVCRNDDNVVIHNITQHIISMFDEGKDKDQVLTFANKLNEI